MDKVEKSIGLKGEHKIAIAIAIGVVATFAVWQLASKGYFGQKVQTQATKLDSKIPQKTTTQTLASKKVSSGELGVNENLESSSFFSINSMGYENLGLTSFQGVN